MVVHRSRVPEKRDLSKISRRARVINSSEVLFEVKFGSNERYKFRREGAKTYVKPMLNSSVRCIYLGDKTKTFPYKVYSGFDELIYEEGLEGKVKI